MRPWGPLLLTALLLGSATAAGGVGAPAASEPPSGGAGTTTGGSPASPLLGTYVPGAWNVPTGGSYPIDPWGWLEQGPGSPDPTTAFSLQASVVPPSLGSVEGDTFYAGSQAGSGTLELTGTYDGRSVHAEALVEVYSPVCLLASIGTGPLLTLATGGSVQVRISLEDQEGYPCSAPFATQWSLYPSTLGALNTSVGGSVTFQAGPEAGNGWLNATTEVGGQSRFLSEGVAVVPSVSETVLGVTPAAVTLPEDGSASFSALLSDQAGLEGPFDLDWTVFPTSLGEIEGAGNPSQSETVDLLPGTVAVSGEVNVSLTLPNGVVLSASSQVTVVPSPTVGPPVGVVVEGGADLSSLAADQSEGVTLDEVDAQGDLEGHAPAVTWALAPSGLGHLVVDGANATLTAGASGGNGTLWANFTTPLQISVSLPFFVHVEGPGALTGLASGEGSTVSPGGFLSFEGVWQDQFGNLELTGARFDLETPGDNVTWSVLPSSLGTVHSEGAEGSESLPEIADFYAGPTPGAGTVDENLTWDGDSASVAYPVEIVPSTASAFDLDLPSVGDSVLGEIPVSSSETLAASVLNGEGEEAPTVGNFSWELSAASAGTLVGSPNGPTVELQTTANPGPVLGNCTWTYAGEAWTEEFYFETVEPTLALPGLTLSTSIPLVYGLDSMTGDDGPDYTPGGALPIGAQFNGYVSGEDASEGTVTWSLAPADSGTLSTPTGSDSTVTLSSVAGPEWLNASVLLPDGTTVLASFPFVTYDPVLSQFSLLTGPCGETCSRGVAGFSGGDVYAAVEPLDQEGFPLTDVTWSGSVSPGDLATVELGPWDLASPAVLANVELNATPGTGNVTLYATWEGITLPYAFPVDSVAPPAPLSPTVPQDVSAEAGVGSATLTWGSPELSGARLSSYTIQLAPALPNGTEEISVPALGPSEEILLAGLAPGTNYSVRLAATDVLGATGPWSAPVFVVPLGTPPGSGGTAPSVGGGNPAALLLLSALAMASALLLALAGTDPRKVTGRPDAAGSPVRVEEPSHPAEGPGPPGQVDGGSGR